LGLWKPVVVSAAQEEEMPSVLSWTAAAVAVSWAAVAASWAIAALVDVASVVAAVAVVSTAAPIVPSLGVRLDVAAAVAVLLVVLAEIVFAVAAWDLGHWNCPLQH
jgi:hypothetical protein